MDVGAAERGVVTLEASVARAVLDVVTEQSRRVLETYRVDPGLIQEHANNERRIAQGGYGDRQVYELVQNAADEIRNDPGGEIAVVLTATHLYCANQGAPVTPEGADTILRMSVSRKRGGQIGRFGVGVKSVLAICDTPQFFSKADGVEFGFGFDRAWSSALISSLQPGITETPVLRMAQPLDPGEFRRTDPVLKELLDWATTVVRLPLAPGAADRLGADLKAFPVEFSLFSAHVGTVTLEDRRFGRPLVRQIFQHVDGARRVLQEERPDGETRNHVWRVFSRTHRPSPEALRAAGELHDRPEIDISWAVPQRSGSRGMFWAYFPTKFATTLRGILNAPWKTSEDRQAIFDGNAFNNELIKVAARLVVESLPDLSSVDDPADYIDYLPGRGREAPQFADERLTHAIWDTAAHVPSIIDQNGRLRCPDQLRLHPPDMREEWLKLWAGYGGRPSDWAHHSVEQRERRARVNLILERAGTAAASVREWLEALVADGSAEASAVAIRISADIVAAGHPGATDAVEARIVRTESHGMVAPERGRVFRRSTSDQLHDDLVYVDEAVVAGFGVPGALDTLGIREADPTGRLAAVVDQGFSGYSDEQWYSFWELSRAAGPVRSLDVLGGRPADVRAAVRIRTVSGTLRPVGDCLLPGAVVPADGSRDADIAADMAFHAPDREVLLELGLLDRPVPDQDPRGEPWFMDYRAAAWDRHLKSLDDRAHRPQLATMRVEGPNPPGPLRFLTTLSPEGRAAFLANLPDRGSTMRWTVQVGRQEHTRQNIASPLYWAARRFGHVDTSLGLRRVQESVGPQLAQHSDILPVAQVPEHVAAALSLPATLAKVPAAIWKAAVVRAAESVDIRFPGKVYALLIESGVEIDWPEGVGTRCRIGDEWSSEIHDSEIAVTADPAEYALLLRERVPTLLVPNQESADRLIDSWTMLRPSAVIEKEVRHVAEAEPVPLLDLFPHLRLLTRSDLGAFVVVRCAELEEVVRTPNGMGTNPLPHAVSGKDLYVLRPEDDLDLLSAVDDILELGLGPEGCRSILDKRQRQRETDRIRAIREARTEEAKVLHLIGEDNLRAGLPRGLEEDEEATAGARPRGERLARLAIDAFGDGVLRHYGKDLATRHEDAPRTFAGSTASRRFVTELGLPEAFAGTADVAPPEMEEVDGPSEYPRLHDYQEQVTNRMVDLLMRHEPARGMLRLPTGAGKTRVAVEAVIRVARQKRLVGPVLWIAQSNELCEQAVQSWKFVWSKVGPEEKLTINRFWGGNDAVPVSANTQLVVATDVQLERRLAGPDYAWLRTASVVIVDEAHRAITPRYTGILEQLGLTWRHTARPLIGLTATPFRGVNEAETKRLVDRFHGYRLDEGLFPEEDPYPYLQSAGVLARVEHRELRGMTLRLSDAELAQVDLLGTLPSSAEEALARDAERNRKLIEEISALPEEWPVLVFATSINHARLLTARLNGLGIPSRSIDSYTPPSERRNTIDAYRKGRIRVITNYGVLAQGFDAPATRAVVIARPTYSPNVYQQMIGRGLRGPRNGGKATCLILDVHDNIENYDQALAFTGFEHLWSAQ
jgi:superfamily II DNA or RNA helicase